MKKVMNVKILLCVFTIICFCSSVSGQITLMVKDSGIYARKVRTDTLVKNYIYNGQLHLTRIDYVGGANSMPMGYDKVYTDANGRIDSLVTYDMQNQRTGEYLKNYYTGNDLMKQERPERGGGMGNPPRISTNIFKYSNGVLTFWGQLHDTTGNNKGGGPDSVVNIVNAGGNPVSGLMYFQPDTGTLTVEFDSMPNPFKGWAVTDEFPMVHSTNNVRKAYLVNPPVDFFIKMLGYTNGRLTSSVQYEKSDSGGASQVTYHYYTYASNLVGITPAATILFIKAMPNPSKGSFVLEASTCAISSLQVYDINGRLVHELGKTNTSGMIQLDLTSQPAGIYYLKAISSDGTGQLKLIKE